MLDGDDEVRARMMEMLEEHEFDVSALQVEVAGGRVRLRGLVPDEMTALLVEDLAWSMPEVCDCDNHLQVEPQVLWSLAV